MGGDRKIVHGLLGDGGKGGWGPGGGIAKEQDEIGGGGGYAHYLYCGDGFVGTSTRQNESNVSNYILEICTVYGLSITLH